MILIVCGDQLEMADDGIQKQDVPYPSEAVQKTRILLLTLLQEQVSAHLLNEQALRILILRLGLKDGHCCTLDETSHLMHKSPEIIRQHQHLALRKATRDINFHKALQEYAHFVKLPRGVSYYVYDYKTYHEKAMH
jgi:DNA-directed RNA polymerase sigma subunit (sigma70/sigma32)